MLRRFPRVRAVAAVVAVMALASTQACYAYKPIASVTPKVGERVRVVLTPQGTVELARYLGPNVTVAEGGLSSVGGEGALVIAVDFVQMTNGVRQPWTGEGVVSIPSAYRSEVHERTFLKRQSIFGVTGLAVGLMAVAVIALRSGGAGGSSGGGGVPPPP
jgi:hypothetical protein